MEKDWLGIVSLSHKFDWDFEKTSKKIDEGKMVGIVQVDLSKFFDRSHLIGIVWKVRLWEELVSCFSD